MGQASILTDTEVRRVFRIVETTRNASRNRVAFVYLTQRRISNPGAPLVPSQRNGRAFSSVTLSMLFKESYEVAGIRTSSHSGRRTFATRLNARGVGMRTIQRLMGHKHISTTALYCDV